MEFDVFKDKIYPYLDGELEAKDREAFKQQMKECPLSQMAYEKEAKLHAFLSKQLKREEAPYELREAVVKKLEQESWRERLFRGFGPRKVQFASFLASAVAIIALVSVLNFNQPLPVYAAAVENHMDYLSGKYPMEIKTNDVNEALAWFEGKLDYAVERPHLNPEKSKLIGARIVHIKDRKAAYFVFENNGHTISTFFFNVEEKEIPKVVKSDVIKESQTMKIMFKAEKGYKNIFCLHKTVHSGCLIVSDMPKEQLAGLMG